MKRSSTKTPNAATIATDPMKFQSVTTSIPAPNTTSDANTSTVVKRPPMDVMMGPHTPKRICTECALSPGRTDGEPKVYHKPGIEYNPSHCDAGDHQSNIPIRWPVKRLGSYIVENRQGDPKEKENEDASQ